MGSGRRWELLRSGKPPLRDSLSRAQSIEAGPVSEYLGSKSVFKCPQILLLPQVSDRALAVYAQLAPRDRDFRRRLVEVKNTEICVFRPWHIGCPSDLIASREQFAIM